MTANSKDGLHPFQRAGLGIAPFKYIGMTEKVIKHADGTEQPSGTCDYCSNGIRYCYQIQSADGKVFQVGSDCVMKIYRLDNEEFRDPIIAKIGDERRRLERNARHQREAKKIEIGRKLFDDNRAYFETLPHPHEYYRSQGQTLADSIEWYFQRGGNSGRLSMIRMMERLLKERDEK